MLRSAAILLTAAAFAGPALAQPPEPAARTHGLPGAPGVEMSTPHAVDRATDRATGDAGQPRTAPQANTSMADWRNRMAGNPRALDPDDPLHKAWTDARKAHADLMRADEAQRQDAQDAFDRRLDDLEKAWQDSQD